MSDEDPQLRLFPGVPSATSEACAARLWLRCRECGGIETRTLSCSRPCAQCPWGPMRVRAASGRLPRVPLRHWVLVPPPRWARVLPGEQVAGQAFRRAVAAHVISAIEGRARDQLGHGRGRAGALAVLHTVGADLQPRAHVHIIATDGVFVPAARGVASFVPLAQPFGSAELRELARTVGAEARRAVPEPAAKPLGSSGVRVAGDRPGPGARGVVTSARGSEVFVGERVAAGDRRATERLAAYVTRPPLGPASVRAVGEDMVELKLREPARDGAVAVRLSKPAFDARVRAMVEGRASRRLTLHGALAPGSSVRWRGEGMQLTLVDATPAAPKRTKVRRAERCRCGGRLEVVAAEPVVLADEGDGL